MNIIRQLFEVILKKRAPENIDYNINAVVALCVLSIFQSFFALKTISELTQPFFYSVILVASQVIAYALLFKTQKKENRIVQSLTALIGVTVILHIPMFILSQIPALSLLSLFLQIYTFIISVKILKSSFSCPTYLAVVIFISVSFFCIAMLFILMPSALNEYVLYIERVSAAATQVQQ